MTTQAFPTPPLSAPARPATGGKIWQGIWRVADPKITLASVASIVLGAGVAAYQGPIAWGWLALTLLGIFFIEAAKNASGEIFDWDSGADKALLDSERTPFSGGKRVLVDGLLTRRQTAVVASVFYALGIGMGLAIMIFREPNVIWLGMLGVGLAYFYHAPPLSFAYRGMGELAVGLAYGPVIACGTYLVQRHTISPEVFLASLPFSLAIITFLWINEIPDARADELADKCTLVVRLGRRSAAQMFPFLVAITYLALWALPLVGLPRGILLGTIGLPFAIRAAVLLLRSYDKPADLVPAQSATLLSFVLLALGSAVGLVLPI